jgi:dTDP-glucose pyrophosphorylase
LGRVYRKDSVALVLGDNIFLDLWMNCYVLIKILKGSCFAYHVSDPERYGVVELIKNLMHLEENL